MNNFLECINCLKENKKYFEQGVKWNFPANVIYQGNSYCREHYEDIVNKPKPNTK